MPRKLPPFVYRETTRHGRAVYYFRSAHGRGDRIRLPDYGSPEFDAAYLAALTGATPEASARKPADPRSLGWLIARYRETSAYLHLSIATRRQRDNIFQHVIRKNGHVQFQAVTRKKIVEAREDRASTPARHFLDTMRGLFAWAVEAQHVAEDPTEGVRNPKRSKSDGFPAWTNDDVALFEAHWPQGSKERVWLHVLLYTGLRRGDAVTLGRQHVRGDVASLRTEKSQRATEVHFRILPQLAATLATGPTGDLSYICGADGKPLVKETFGNYFREACNAAGVKKSAHGLRKLAAVRAAEAGVTTAQLEALFGWTGGKMASHYTKSADRKRLAAEGSRALAEGYRENENRSEFSRTLGENSRTFKNG
jgi:integrase